MLLRIVRWVYGLLFALFNTVRLWRYVHIFLSLAYSLFVLIFLPPILFFFAKIEKIVRWWRSRPQRKKLLRRLAAAQTYEEWLGIAHSLDEAFGTEVWRHKAAHPLYNYDHILRRLHRLTVAQAEDDPLTATQVIRSGLIRNLVSITAAKLYDQAFAGTKVLIEDYAAVQGSAAKYVAGLKTLPPHRGRFNTQQKLDFIRTTRQGFGRTSLLIQGGNVFGICHLGVVKALYLNGMLPRIITGTSTGAFVAGLVCIRTDNELMPLLNGETIDLAAFNERRRCWNLDYRSLFSRETGYGWVSTFMRRIGRFVNYRCYQDFQILEDCARANFGDITFEEAYARTMRILNIAIPMHSLNTPNLLNYLTAPNVLIWSAAIASNVSSVAGTPMYLYCKDETGVIVPWPQEDITLHSWHQIRFRYHRSPLYQLPALFNVTHYIVSQARPYVIPLFRVQLNRPGEVQALRWPFIPRVNKGHIGIFLRHRIYQVDHFRFLPNYMRRILIEEDIPNACVVVLPAVTPLDAAKIFKTPTTESIKYWIWKGESGTWPSMSSIKVRCTLEFELEKAYQTLRGRVDNDIIF